MALPGPTLRKSAGPNNGSPSSMNDHWRTLKREDREKGNKILQQEESRTKKALLFLAIMVLFFLAAIVKLRHNPSIRFHGSNGSLRSLRNWQPEESSALEEVTRGSNAHFIPPHSIYSLSVEDITGKMVSLEKFHGMVTLVVNVACM